MIGDLTSGKIDAGILWGPMAGFYAKKANPPLHVTPLVKEKTGPRLAFRIGMGVRRADQNWKRLLNRLIQENQPAINKILLDYGVPLLDENDRPIGAETATKVAMREALAGLILAAFTFTALDIGAGKASRARRISHGQLSRAGSRDACRRARSDDRGGRGDLASQGGRLHRRAASRAEAAKSSRRHGLARQAAAQHSRQHLAAGHRLRQSWRPRRKTICGAGSSARRRATTPRCW